MKDVLMIDAGSDIGLPLEYIYARSGYGLVLASRSTDRLIQVAADIFTAQQSGKDFIYSQWFWRYIMLVFRMIPESIDKKLNFS